MIRSEDGKTHMQKFAKQQGSGVFDGPKRFQVRLVKLKSDEILVWRVSSAVLETA